MKPHEHVILEVARERERQLAKGYDDEHDAAEHWDGEIAYAAAALAVLGHPDEAFSEFLASRIGSASLSNLLWPDTWGEIKDEGRRSNLIRAAAQLVAEIERLDRAAADQEVEIAFCRAGEALVAALRTDAAQADWADIAAAAAHVDAALQASFDAIKSELTEHYRVGGPPRLLLGAG